jgi:NTE family protein
MKHLNLLSFLILFVFALFTASCASKRVTPSPVPPPVPQPEQSSTSVPPVDATQPAQPTPPTETPVSSSDAPRVGLVLGGAGVASFATVGILKRFQEEGIAVEFIVTTGWPTLFALGRGFLKSVHDLEWFAMRLNEKDFYKASDGYAAQDNLSALVESNFKQKELGDAKIPVVISAANTEFGDADIYDQGDWRAPVLKTMSVPGIYRPYPQDKDKEWISSLQGMDVGEAVRRGSKIIVAVEMYDDYFAHLKGGKKDSSDRVFRQLYLTQLRKSISREMKDAHVTGKIRLGNSPTDFNAKRLAIFAGYKEGARLVKQIRAKAKD